MTRGDSQPVEIVGGGLAGLARLVPFRLLYRLTH